MIDKKSFNWSQKPEKENQKIKEKIVNENLLKLLIGECRKIIDKKKTMKIL